MYTRRLILKVNRCMCKRNLNTQQRDLENRVALVTGSTSGIGLSIAETLAKQGCSIILNGFGDPIQIENIQTEIQRSDVQVNYIAEDLSTIDGNAAICYKIRQKYPNGIDILINNAGIQHVSPIDKFSVKKWNEMINIMLTSPFYLIQQFLIGMKKKGWGRIVNISSVHGLVASPNKAGYVTAKHGLLGLTKVVALETAGSGVTCNAICPGFVDTEIFQNQVRARSEEDGCSNKEAMSRILETVHPTVQPVETDQVAKFVQFVCSDAASQMTGSCLTMDAGWTCR